jgi:hypothetical protein
MARHESEMHRQARLLRDALLTTRRLAKRWNENRQPIDLPGLIMMIDHVLIDANAVGQSDELFADRSQMDLQDRRDI